MEQIILSQSIVNGRNILSPSALTTNDAIYIVRDDFEIVEPINLPLGCELRIEGGSIKASKLDDNAPLRGKIYMTPQPQPKSSRNTEFYDRLTIASTAKESVSDNTISYTPNEGVFLADGCVLKSTTDYHFEIFVNTPCRIELPEEPRGTLHINSDKVNSIQIDGKCDFQIHAENCKFQRIFANKCGWAMTNRIEHNTDYNIFENCEIWANDFPKNANTDSNFLSLSAGVIIGNETNTTNPSTETINWLIIKDSMISDLGINGTINVSNCTFLFGSNTNNNYETIHCGNHSRITNCLFDGRQEAGIQIPNLTADVIDLFNGHDIIIDGCTFIGYISENEAGRNIITVKSHYAQPAPTPETPQPNDNPANSDRLGGPQNGVIIRNCHFDLPKFLGYVIEVWNGVVNSANENRELNRQFTLIESNYIYAPYAKFVNCYSFTDYLTIRNNVGQIDMLVYIPDELPGQYGNGNRNIVHNLIVDGNILRSQIPLNNPDGKPRDPGMRILWGTSVENIELVNNKVLGYLWGGLNYTTQEYVSGVVRITNNETTGGRGLFKDYGEGATEFSNTSEIFFSGNISNGKRTDLGSMTVANSQSDSINFAGRQFFCTEGTNANKLLIYNGSRWIVIQ